MNFDPTRPASPDNPKPFRQFDNYGIHYEGIATGPGHARQPLGNNKKVVFFGDWKATSCDCSVPVAAAAAAVPAVATAAAGGLVGGGRMANQRLLVALLLGMFIYMLLRTPRRDEQAY